MQDVAREAGVSRGAASFALNDRPGVSDETRARVKRVAAELGWVAPSPAALALSSRTARAAGLVITRPTEAFASEGFFLRLIAGVERVLQPAGLALVLQVVPDMASEVAACRALWGQGRVDGMVLVDPRQGDPRPALMAELSMPGVMVGGRFHGTVLSGLSTDDEGALRTVVDHLHRQGHRRIAYVAGAGDVLHAADRHRAIAATAAARGVEVIRSSPADASEEAGRGETEGLLASGRRPTAIIFDNEVLAVGGLSAVHAAGLRCPQDVAIVSCEESAVCRVVTPALTSLVRDASALGAQAAQMLLDLLAGQAPVDVTAPAPELVVRGSTVTP